MKLYTVDGIIKSELIRHGLTIHDYVRRAYLALRFLREINFDSAFTFKYNFQGIEENTYTYDLPDDFVGEAVVGIRTGQFLKKLSPDHRLFNDIELDTEFDLPEAGQFGYYGASYWYPSTNWNGEDTGGYYGVSLIPTDTYKIEGNKIIFNNNVIDNNVGNVFIVKYISDGIEYNSDGGVGHIYVHPYATEAMISYIDWKMSSEGNRFVNRELKSEYYNELRKYRARINPITIKQLKESFRSRSYLSIKS